MLGPQVPKQYIFGNYFYWINDKRLRFYVYLLFHVKKYGIILPEVDRIHKKLQILF